MDEDVLAALARATLYMHFAVVVFNAGGLVFIVIGAWRNWRWVHAFWWRALHMASLLVVALQVLLGRDCFLTVWQTALESAANVNPADMAWLDRIVFHAIFWPLPSWAFAVLYALAFALTVLLWRAVPVRRGH